MAAVRLEFTPEPAHVRTVRLIGVAVARQAGVLAEQLDEVRLAVGEACVRAITRHREQGLRHPIVVTFAAGESYEVRVLDRAPDPDPVDGDELTDADVGAALLAGLVSGLQVYPVEPGPGSEVRMAWPVRRAARR